MPRPLALAYCRVSTADQVESGASLAAQEAALRAEADRRGWNVEIVREEGKSAKSLRRPALMTARSRLARGEAQFLISLRLDRLSRSVADFAALVDEAKRKGWGLVLLSPNLDLSDPAGLFTANVLASAAQYERALISTRVREGMAQRKSEGQHMGRRADPAMHDTYRRILAEHAAGASYNAIAAGLTADGVPTARGGVWVAATVRKMVLSETAKAL